MIDYFKLFGLANPYERFRGNPNLQLKMHGWNGNLPFFETIITETRPTTIIEIGSFLGKSATNMGRITKKLGIDTAILCIDTWLGSDEHWRTDGCNMLNWWDNFSRGTSVMYDQFIINIILAGLDDRVFPLPNTSTTIYKMLKWKQVTADLIYVDGSHDKEDVKKDIRMYWEILNPGGTMFGDDYIAWKDVRDAVNESSVSMGVPVVVREQPFWTLKKV